MLSSVVKSDTTVATLKRSSLILWCLPYCKICSVTDFWWRIRIKPIVYSERSLNLPKDRNSVCPLKNKKLQNLQQKITTITKKAYLQIEL